jgi:hypothetical protein
MVQMIATLENGDHGGVKIFEASKKLIIFNDITHLLFSLLGTPMCI